MNQVDAQLMTQQRPQPASSFRMVAAVVSVGTACALAIVTVHEFTRPIIQRNQIEYRQRAVLDVVPGATTTAAFQYDDQGQFVRVPDETTDGEIVFAGYDAEQRLVGLALETQAVGYQDVVRVLYGYSPQQQTIVGIRVLESRETPGLGDRIESDPDFLRNFEALDVQLMHDGRAVAHPVAFVKPGEKQHAWQIDGISGATITSRATAKMLRESSQVWVPRVVARLADFESQATESGSAP